ncbi:hypothetical protein [Pseudomonas helleri]|uniref:hypothetical protein n=1 Tax=Pseudomonas helleri TaxID=1608996 RepID=UPI0024331A92|nr:hypothetical protein [Pseudomonas helleri]
MSEVRRWKLKGFIPGIEGETRALFQPTVVLSDDYDAALAREAALREERDTLQQRLTDAEKKLGEAYEWGYIDGQNSPNGYSDKADRDKCVAELLKPEEGS